MLVLVRIGERAATRAPGWTVALAAGAGLLIAANLVLGRVTGVIWFCGDASDCGAVHASRYATFLGVPIALVGALLYAVVVWLAFSGLSSLRWLAAFLLAVVALSASLYLARIAWVVIDRACVYCLVSTGTAAALVLALLAARPRTSVRPLHPCWLVALAGVTALATVTIVAVALGNAWPSR